MSISENPIEYTQITNITRFSSIFASSSSFVDATGSGSSSSASATSPTGETSNSSETIFTPGATTSSSSASATTSSGASPTSSANVVTGPSQSSVVDNPSIFPISAPNLVIIAQEQVVGTRKNDQLRGSQQNDAIQCKRGNDKVQAGNGDDQVSGGNGNDRLAGNADDDWLKGGIGDDYLLGENGDDTLEGGSGKDILVGGFGWDRLTGGGDADIFVLAAEAAEPTFADIVTDFSVAQGDKLKLGKGLEVKDLILSGIDSNNDGIQDATLIRSVTDGKSLAVVLNTINSSGRTMLSATDFT